MFAKSKKSLSLAVIAVVLGSLLVACGPTKTTVDVTLESYKITPSTTSVPAGEVTFNATNVTTDGMVHEMLVVKTDLSADELPLDADGNIPEDQINSLGEVSELEPGDLGTVTLTLEAGHYILLCNQPGHFTQGMHIDFTVN